MSASRTKVELTHQSQIHLLQGSISPASFEVSAQELGLEASKCALVFPSNPSHHTPNTTLYSIKRGGGLAAVASQLGDQQLPTLGLPTTGMPILAKDAPIPMLAKKAVADLWKAAGYGIHLMLPVRKPTQQYFSHEFSFSPVEPKFWGAIEKTPNIILADYYLEQLDKLQAFLVGRQPALDQLDPDFLTAYREGQAARQQPTAWFQSLQSTLNPLPSRPSVKNARLQHPVTLVKQSAASRVRENKNVQPLPVVAPPQRVNHLMFEPGNQIEKPNSTLLSNAMKIGAVLVGITAIAIAIALPEIIPVVAALFHISTAALPGMLLTDAIIGGCAMLAGSLLGAMIATIYTFTTGYLRQENVDEVIEPPLDNNNLEQPLPRSTLAHLQKKHGLKIERGSNNVSSKQVNPTLESVEGREIQPEVPIDKSASTITNAGKRRGL